MNDLSQSPTSHKYLLWPVAVLFVLTVGVFFTTREPVNAVLGISTADMRLALGFLFLFVVALSAGILFFFKKIT